MLKPRIGGLIAAALISAYASTALAQEALKVGALLPLTGPAAPIGLEQQQGVQFAVDLANAQGGVNGKPIELVLDDSQGKPDQAVLAFNRMADLDQVPALITAFSSISLAIAPLATRREILVMNPAAQTDKLADASEFLINTIPLVNAESQVMTKYAFEHIGKTASLLYENAAAGIAGRDDFRNHFEALGGKVIAEEPVEFGQTNYRAALLKINASKPDFVYIAITQSHETMADQVGQIEGFPVAVGNTFSRPFFGYPSTEGWYQSAIQSNNPETKTLEAFKAKYDTKGMGFFAREYFNATNIVIEAAKALSAEGKELSGVNLRDTVLKIKTFKSPIAEITFHTSTALRPVEIQQYVKGTRKVIEVATPVAQ